MNEQEKTRAETTATEQTPSAASAKEPERAVWIPKFVQRRGVRGFNNRPMPARFPDPTPAPPPPKWRVPVEERKA